MKAHAQLQQAISQIKSLQTHHIVCMIRKLEPSIQITAQSCMQELHDHNIEFRSLRTHKAAIVSITFLLIRFAPFKKTCSAVERNQWLHCSMVGASKAVRPQRSAVERKRWLHCYAKIQAITSPSRKHLVWWPRRLCHGKPCTLSKAQFLP